LVFSQAVLHNKLPPFGETHSTAIFKESEVLEVFDLYEQGWMQKSIAEKFNTSTSNISVILNGKRWKHLGKSKAPSNHCKSHLTTTQKQEIIKLYNEGIGSKELSLLFAVNQSTITRTIQKHKTTCN
jgi:DNA-binding NarL/FixJ family response regulator